MDSRLVTWARAVKARRGGTPLWLFTDVDRTPDPLASIAALPKRLCGVIFRHDGVPGRAALASDVAALCRARRLPLSVAGDWRLAARLGAGVHMRAGAGPRHGRWRTSSAHTVAELIRARRAGALIFLSPVFPTASHVGISPLGPLRWTRMASIARCTALALGGIDGARIRRLPRRWAAGAGAIGALGAGNPTS